MKRLLVSIAAVGIVALASTVRCAAQGQIDSIWTEHVDTITPVMGMEAPFTPVMRRVFDVNKDALQSCLAAAPMEFSAQANSSTAILNLPRPDGSVTAFAMVESPILAPDIQASHPELRTYSGRGVTDRSATCRISVTPKGLHGFILGLSSTVFLDPVHRNAPYLIMSYSMDDPGLALQTGDFPECSVGADTDTTVQAMGGMRMNAPSSHGSELRTFRLAACATASYTMYHSGPGILIRDSALAAIVIAMNRVNAIFEREVSVRMVLVGGDTLMSTDVGDFMCGLYGTEDSLKHWLDSRIDSSAYDLAHLFRGGQSAFWIPSGTPCAGAGGWAQGKVCTEVKYRGYSGTQTPEGDPYYLLFLAHELGHQFAAQHPHNSTSCGGTRVDTSAYEPGCGSTIMAYTNNGGPGASLQRLCDAYFHRKSLDEIISWTVDSAACADIVSTGNTPPDVSSVTPPNTIPFGTPFSLTGTAGDADQDSLSYCWEQYDLGPAGLPDAPTGNAPIFRSFPPSPLPTRTFPRLTDILYNAHTLGELLPGYARDLHFTLTVRDNRGGTAFDTTMLTVTDQAGPFRVTRPDSNIVLQPDSSYQVEWDVANTDLAPVQCTDVRILLSIDGGYSFPDTLTSSTTNDGSHIVVVPAGVSTYKARIKVSDSAMVGGLFGASANPTLVCDASGAFHLAWEEEGRILYRRFLVDANGHIDSLDAMPVEVSDCAGISHGAKPSITVDEGNRPHVVWETAQRRNSCIR